MVLKQREMLERSRVEHHLRLITLEQFEHALTVTNVRNDQHVSVEQSTAFH